MTPAELLNLVSGSLLAILGITVLLLRGRQRSAAVFGGFALAMAAVVLGFSRSTSAAFPPPPLAVQLATSSFFIATMTFMILAFPKRIQRDDAGMLALALAAGLLHGAARVIATVAEEPGYWSLEALGFGEWVRRILFQFSNAIFPVVITFSGLRVRRLAPDAGRMARSLAFLGTGLALFVAGNADFLVAAARPSGSLAGAFIAPTVFLPATLAWVFAARGAHAGLARRVAIAHAGIFVAAIVLSVFESFLAYPVGRVVGALFLGYAVLGGQIEGLDVKLRFAISKSTIAAVFVGVFFVASELAQQIFADRYQSGAVGIAAAGLLLFAMAPLQRAAEKLAEKAVPVGAVQGIPQHADGSDDLYRRSLRLALADRKLTPHEELTLAELSDRLGLSAKRALEMRQEIEGEARRKKPGGARHRN